MILLISVIPLLAQVLGVLVKNLQIFLPPLNPWLGRLTAATVSLTSAVNSYITMYVMKDYRKKILKLLKASPAVNPAGVAAPAAPPNLIGGWVG